MTYHHVPVATYRLQMNKDFTFDDLKALLRYFVNLGVSDLYLSPVTQAVFDSMHGYDVTNLLKINSQLGGEEKLAQLAEAAQTQDLKLIVDFVPNHMSTSDDNPWWQDVLQQRENSPYQYLFDIDWQKSNQTTIQYRRFFDINELVCLRMEDNEVFQFTHQALAKWVKSGWFKGLRIDHIDGLMDPKQYLHQLQTLIKTDPQALPFYVLVEKILVKDEKLPQSWPIAGTTGYDFLNYINLLFIEKQGYHRLKQCFYYHTQYPYTWQESKYRNKRFVIDHLFDHEFQDLAARWQSDFDPQMKLSAIDETIRAFSAGMPCYRTYIDTDGISDRDMQYLKQAYEISEKFQPELSSHLEHLCQTLLELNQAEIPDQKRQKFLNWISRWQCMTGPVMAKGFEDTTCYQYNVLLSLDEVGSDPDFEEVLGSTDAVHLFLKNRQAASPFALNATSTHDTKFSEDARMRLNVLSELAREYENKLNTWCDWNASKKVRQQGKLLPDTNAELRIYQSLLATWPLEGSTDNQFKTRFDGYLPKMAREAKMHSTWKQPNEAYEESLLKFTEAILDPNQNKLFYTDFIQFAERIAFYGMLNSLSGLTLKCLSPGIPDIYQGCDCWDFSLVDPDNRRPVDFKKRQNRLDKSPDIDTLKLQWPSGEIKLWMTQKLLTFRQRYKQLFQAGEYKPLLVEGVKRDEVFAFARTLQKQYVLCIVPRYFSQLVAKAGDWPCGHAVWHNTRISLPKSFPDEWHHIFTNEVFTFDLDPNKQPVLMLSHVSHALPWIILSSSIKKPKAE